MENCLLKKRAEEHIASVAALAADAKLVAQTDAVAKRIVECYRKGGKTIFMGNGGSAADAQHMAAEFLGKYLMDRKPIPSLALTANSSAVTAIGNDYGYAQVFRRQLEAWAGKNDVAIGLSTSGNSENVVEALKWAKENGIFCVAIVGAKKCELDAIADICIKAPSDVTPRIQEMHELILHTICEIVENELFG